MTRSPLPALRRGVFVVSIDTEFGWGRFDRPDREACWRLEENGREVIAGLLSLFERYEISATWAMVGHLFLERCEPMNGVCHPEIRRPNHAWFPRDWYHYDPGTDAATDPLWYAPDVIRTLLAAGPRQEIASHSFAHPILGDAGCSAEAARADLRACVDAAEAWSVPLRSFVFPRNRVAHLDVLADAGFRCYRGPDPAWYARFPRPAKRLAHFLDDLLALAPPTVLPTRVGRLWNLPGSMMVQGLDGLRGWIPPGCRTRRGIAGLWRAAGRREIFHLWFHPSNFATGTGRMLSVLEPVLREADRLRARGELDVLTMGELADRLEAERGSASGSPPEPAGAPRRNR